MRTFLKIDFFAGNDMYNGFKLAMQFNNIIIHLNRDHTMILEMELDDLNRLSDTIDYLQRLFGKCEIVECSSSDTENYMLLARQFSSNGNCLTTYQEQKHFLSWRNNQ